MKTTFALVISVVMFLLALPPISAQSSAAVNSGKSLFDMMQEADLKIVRISTDLNKLKQDRRKHQYQPAAVRLSFADGSEMAETAKIRPRGRFRNGFCELPPIKIKFNKKSLERLGLKDLNECKMVLPARLNNREYNNWLYKEFLAYQLYDVLGEESFRTELIMVQFVDSKTGEKLPRTPAFLIEDREEVAARLAVEEIDRGMAPDTLDQQLYARMQVFSVHDRKYGLATDHCTQHETVPK